MRHSGSRALLGMVAILLAALVLPALGQQKPRNNFNERSVEKRPHAEDLSGIWMLDFHFKDPRLVTVDVPGRGRKLVWYLWYQVSNSTGAPRTFIPKFVWVCHDEDSVHEDQLLPKAQQAVRRSEDPTNLLDIKNSVTISRVPIPVSKEAQVAYPKLVTGVATWDDVNLKCDRFSIYVYGLSDGWRAVDGPDGKPIVRRKTLQLRYKRSGDEFLPSAEEIKYLGHEWVYAPAELPPSVGDEKKEEKKPAPPKQEPPKPKPAPATGQPRPPR